MGEIGCGTAGPGLGMLPLEATVGDLLSRRSFGRAGASVGLLKFHSNSNGLFFRIEKIRGAGWYLFCWLR